MCPHYPPPKMSLLLTRLMLLMFKMLSMLSMLSLFTKKVTVSCSRQKFPHRIHVVLSCLESEHFCHLLLHHPHHHHCNHPQHHTHNHQRINILLSSSSSSSTYFHHHNNQPTQLEIFNSFVYIWGHIWGHVYIYIWEALNAQHGNCLGAYMRRTLS